MLRLLENFSLKRTSVVNDEEKGSTTKLVTLNEIYKYISLHSNRIEQFGRIWCSFVFQHRRCEYCVERLLNDYGMNLSQKCAVFYITNLKIND